MRRLSGSTNWFSFANLTGSPSSTNPHALFVVCATGTLPVSGNEYRALANDCGALAVAAAIRINDAGGVVFSQKNAAGSTVYSYTQAGVFSASSAPHALALVYDGTNCIAYVDGTQVNSAVPGSLGARGAFSVSGSQADGDSSTSLDVGHALLFTQALTAAQIKTLGRSRVPTSIPSANVQGWWSYRTGRPATDLSKFKQNLNGTSASGAPDERWVGDMRRAKVFLPQYMLQPPIVLTAGNRTDAPNAALTSSAVVASTAGATSNCPSASVTSSAVVASTAAAVSNAPSASITAGAPVASVAQNTTNVPSVTLLNAPAVASTASAVSNAPTVTLSRNLPVVSVASAVTNAPSATINAGAAIVSVAATVTDAPQANIAGGLGSTASTTTDCPAVSLARNLPIACVAGSTTNSTAAISSGAPVVQTPAQNVTNAPTATITSSGVVASTAAATTNAPSAVIATGASVASVASTASNCPAAALSRALSVAAVSGSRSDCPPADVVVLVFKAIASVCGSTTDCPPPPYMTFFKDVTAPPMTLGRTWPPRPR